MVRSQKHVFWQALLVTILIFGVGIFLGFILENWRTNQIDALFQQSEVDLLDMKLQNEIYSSEDFNCDLAIEANLNFADRIYEEAKKLERYEKASRLTESLKIQHKKYDLLRVMLLLNSLKITENCGSSYSEIVYFYALESEELTVRAQQNVFSKALLDVKENYGGDILLVPIGVGDEISSITLLLDNYNVSRNELPTIVINQDKKLTEIESIRDIEGYLD